jgi:hypothetical protein
MHAKRLRKFRRLDLRTRLAADNVAHCKRESSPLKSSRGPQSGLFSGIGFGRAASVGGTRRVMSPQQLKEVIQWLI